MAGNNRGGQRRNNQQQGDQNVERSENQQISDRELVIANIARESKLRGILMNGIDEARLDIEAFLPKDCSFSKFRQIVAMATERNADILTCTPRSILLASRAAAYDGLMPDGREGAMIPSNNSYKIPVPGSNATRLVWRREARWSPMIAGVRKQILKGGIVSDLITDLVYAEEVKQGRFKIKRGTDPSIEHEPFAMTQDRGDAVGVYSVAYFFDGRRPTFEYMTKEQVYAVRDSAQSGAVWKGKLESEMWRKTVARRHRKSLPGCNDIIDMEARELFPEFSTTGSEIIDQTVPATSRPTREAVQQRLEDQQGRDAGTPLDFGEEQGELVEAGVDQETGEFQQRTETSAKEPDVEQSRGNEQRKEPETGKSGNKQEPDPKRTQKSSLPADQVEWEAWQAETLADLKACQNLGEVDALRVRVNPVLERANKPMLEVVTGAFQDAIADFV